MAEEPEQDPPKEAPDLELPSFFGRKKKKAEPAEAPVDPPVETPTESARRLPPMPPPPPPARVPEERGTSVSKAPAPEPVEPEPTPEPARVPEERGTSVSKGPAPEPVEPTPAAEPTLAEPARVPEERGTSVSKGPAPEPTLAEPILTEPEPEPIHTEPARVPEERGTSVSKGPAPEPVEQFPAPKPKRERTPLALPRVNPYLATVVAGLICGLVVIVLELGAQHGCEAVRGVGSCGGIGLFALLAILGLAVLLGGALLRVLAVKDPTSTALLGIGIVAVVTMVFFLGSLESALMFVVLPLVTAAAFALSYWVTDSIVNVPKDEDTSTTVT